MRALPHRSFERERRGARDALDASMERLFRRNIELSGFSIRKLQGGLSVVDVSLYPDIGDVDALRAEIAASLGELLDERPEVFELLRDRTFARTLH